MHIAYVCQDRGVPVDGLKGSSVHVRSMAQALLEIGHRVTLLSPRIGTQTWAQRLDIQFIESDGDSIIGRLRDLHARSPIDFVYERLALLSPHTGRWCRESGVTHCVEVNAPLTLEAKQHRTLQNEDAAVVSEREVLTSADLVFAVSPWLQRWLRSMGCDEERTCVLPNGVPSAWIVEPSTRKPSCRELLFIGSLRPWHDLPTLLAAMQFLPPKSFQLTVIGDGPMKEKWQQESEVQSFGITWRGAISHDLIPEAIDAADICIAPYAKSENFYFCPIKILEYASRGKPVITADLQELREQFPTDAALYYQPGDARDLADKIELLANDSEFSGKPSARLHAFAADHTWTRHARLIVERAASARKAAAIGEAK